MVPPPASNLMTPSAETCTYSLCASNRFQARENPEGFIDLAIAESHFVADLWEEKLNTLPALTRDQLLYEYSYGNKDTRAVLAKYLAQVSGVSSIDPNHVVLTNGCVSALELVLGALNTSATGVLIPTPYYFNFDKACTLRNKMVPVPVNRSYCTESGKYTLSVHDLTRACQSSRANGVNIGALLLTNPDNPSGNGMTKEELEAVYSFAHEHDIHVIVDEVFAALHFAQSVPLTSAVLQCQSDPRVHVVSGLAKVGVAGLKVGCVLTHNEEVLARAIELSQFTQVSTQTQALLVHALGDPVFVKSLFQKQQSRVLRAYQHTVQSLANAGIPFLPATAGLSITLDLRAAISSQSKGGAGDTGEDDDDDDDDDGWKEEEALIEGLLRRAHVRVMGGSRFHFAQPGYLRLVYSPNKVEIEAAVSRISRYLLDHHPVVFVSHFARRFDAMWARTDLVFSMCQSPEEYLQRPIDLRHPIIFYLGHLPAFSWNQIRKILALPDTEDNAHFNELFERGIDPDIETGECHAHSADIDKDCWPALTTVMAYRDRVRALIKEHIPALLALHTQHKMASRGRILEMAMEHEMMHQETLLYMFQQLPLDAKYRPPLAPPVKLKDGSRALSSEDTRFLHIPAGPAVIGANFDDVPFGWDNEFPANTSHVPAFASRRTPITNGEYLDFVNAGGYQDSKYWTEAAWEWRQARGVSNPVTWWWHFNDPSRSPVNSRPSTDADGEKGEGEWYVHTMLEAIPLSQALSWPVYVSKAEAEAFARFTGPGLRLPTEAEWVRLAELDSATPIPTVTERGNFDFVHWSPQPVQHGSVSRYGVVDCLGNGWEHTSSEWTSHPGFQEYPEYPGYSADFFDGKHFVLRGGSWATDAQIIRPSFRNWYQAHYQYVFSKFRLVRDANPQSPQTTVVTDFSTGFLTKHETTPDGHHYLIVGSAENIAEEKEPAGANVERSMSLEFREHVRRGLCTDPGTAKQLSSMYFYDDVGSEIFTEITQLEEYYLTRCEAEIIRTHRSAIVQSLTGGSAGAAGGFNLIELGCGDGQKTVLLLDEFVKQEVDFQYLPIDISRGALEQMGNLVDREFAKKRQLRLDLQLVCGDNVEALKYLSSSRRDRRSLVLFLGSSIGNYTMAGAITFLKTLNTVLNKGDMILIGFDIIKDFATMHAAYSDSKGVTKRFNTNLLSRMNAELGANFDIETGFEHVATYNVKLHSMESYLVSTREQEVHISSLDSTIKFYPHEGIHTETSMKYSKSLIGHMMQQAGLEIVQHFEIDGGFVDTLIRVC